MNCEVCGTELPHGAMFCGECGRSVGVKTVKRDPDSGMPVIVQAVEPEPEPEPEESATATPHPGDTVIIDPFDLESLAQMPAVVPAAPSAQPAAAAAQVGGDPETATLPDEIEQDLPADFDDPEFPAEPDAEPQPDAPDEPEALATPEEPAERAVRPDPFPWGGPVTPAVAEGIEAVDPEELEQTLIVPRRDSGERFVLQFSTGESVTVSGTGLLGRNPVPQPGEYFDQIVSISDPGKSVSKTHLEFGQESGSFWVSDRFSGNGSVVREPGMSTKRLVSGKRYRIVRGTRVDIGEQFFVVS